VASLSLRWEGKQQFVAYSRT